MGAELQAIKKALARTSNDVGALRARVELSDDRSLKLGSRVDAVEGDCSAAARLHERLRRLEERVEEMSRSGARERETSAALSRRVKALEETLASLRAVAHVSGREGSGDSVSARRPAPHAEALDGASAGAASAPVAQDDLQRIRGIGPKYAAALRASGIRGHGEIAAWSVEDVQRVARRIGIRAERIVRDRWVESARELVDSRR